MDISTREVREERWEQLLLACSESGQTKRTFCQQHGINEKTFYYRQRVIRLKLAAKRTEGNDAQRLFAVEETPTRFAELVLPKSAVGQAYDTVQLRVSGVEIALREDVSEAFLAKLLRAARHAG